eukprot:12677623-Alexandrium_andersonii.AAC.1
MPWPAGAENPRACPSARRRSARAPWTPRAGPGGDHPLAGAPSFSSSHSTSSGTTSSHSTSNRT